MSTSPANSPPAATPLTVATAGFLGLPQPARILPRLALTVTEHCFVPRVDDPQTDWLPSVALPAFATLVRRRGRAACRDFASIGTGCGLDALAAIEVLGAERVGITDVHDDVVAAAAANITGNLQPGVTVPVYGGAGDLLEPLRRHGRRFDVIYENLPNLPLADADQLAVGRTSAGYVPPRPEPVPAVARDNLLVLHYLALRQAHDFLNPGGTVISTLGARVPLRAIAEMAEQAGHRASFLSYGWKVQVDAEELVSAYADLQRQGLGPFHFYRVAALEQVFAGRDGETAGDQALALEQALAPQRLDAVAALAAVRAGERIGHTVAVLQSDPA